jgi:transposase-like protein
MQPKTELRKECVRLRVEERLSISAIQKKTGASKGSLSNWLRPYPLSTEELLQLKAAPPTPEKKNRGEESQLHRTVFKYNTAPSHIGKISEAAVMLRLLAHNISVYGSPFDGDKTDWVVDTGSKLFRLQVRTATQGKTGLPIVSLMRKHKSVRYLLEELDFMIGFDLFTDTAYVWSNAEVSGKNTVTICSDALERWDKLLADQL